MVVFSMTRKPQFCVYMPVVIQKAIQVFCFGIIWIRALILRPVMQFPYSHSSPCDHSLWQG